MEQTVQIVNQIFPVLFFIALGYWIRRSAFILETTIEELRKVVVNLGLPAVLFVSFLNIELEPSYFFFFVFTFSLCILLLLMGAGLQRVFGIEFPYFPYLITGFEYGMLGVSLFGGAFGLENIGYIAVVDLGHEIFIWFVFLPLLLMKRDAVQRPVEIARSFFSSPVVLAIIASIIFNIIGASTWLYEGLFTGGLMAVFDFLGRLTIPLILIVVGYGIKIDRQGLGIALIVVIVRLCILIPLALLVNQHLVRGFYHLDRLFETALFSLLILPPPFIVPLYARSNLRNEESRFINNTLTIHTVFSVIVFLIYFALRPAI
jgi:predicted permease